MLLQQLQPVALELDAVIIADAVEADDALAGLQQSGREMEADEACRAGYENGCRVGHAYGFMRHCLREAGARSGAGRKSNKALADGRVIRNCMSGKRRIAVIGLGYVGLPVAVAFARA